MQERENIILFPKMKERLIQQSFQAIEAEDFAEALKSIDLLIDHQIHDTDITIGKIICHVQLGQHDEAILFCQDVLEDKKNPAFFAILFYYVTLLFEANKYVEIIHYIDELEEVMTVPEEERIKYIEIYEMCLQLVEKEAASLLDDIYLLLKEKDGKKAFILLKKWNRLGQAFPKGLYPYIQSDLHEGIKSYLWQLMMERQVNELITGEKFSQPVKQVPAKMVMPMESNLYKEIEERLDPLANDNPVMEQFLLELLEHYLYMYMPVDLSPEIDDMTEALHFIAEHMFTGELEGNIDERRQAYVQKIMEAERLYVDLFIR